MGQTPATLSGIDPSRPLIPGRSGGFDTARAYELRLAGDPFSFTSPVRNTHAAIEIIATGQGTVPVDFVSMMRTDVRRDCMLRPDLLQALRDLHPSFVRWPGGSFASTYKWKEGIGRYASSGYHPNTFWGGYSDYFGFGTDEFLGLCRKLNAEPLIVLPAPGTKPEQIEDAIDWVHYLNDPATTEWGRLRASNGHPEPYEAKLFQIDNEPMNHGFTPEKYAEIVNVYGSRLGPSLQGRQSWRAGRSGPTICPGARRSSTSPGCQLRLA